MVIGHMHADHYIDIVSLRYLLPWEGVAGAHLPLLLPPGGKARLDALAIAISERPHFFDDAFSVLEYDPAHRLHVGDLTISFVEGQHYVPAWGCVITDPDGTVIAISGDTGPSDVFVEAAHGADLFVAEATLSNAEFDDPRRGHLTPEEALDMADRSGAAQVVLVHFRAELRDRIEGACAGRPGAVAGRPGLQIEVNRAATRRDGPHGSSKPPSMDPDSDADASSGGQATAAGAGLAQSPLTSP
jgi:ribonuclease BN (tRNA processing enzyme)